MVDYSGYDKGYWDIYSKSDDMTTEDLYNLMLNLNKSDDGTGHKVSIRDGSFKTYLNNILMLQVRSFEMYFFDSGTNATNPDHGEVMTFGSSWSIDNPDERGFTMTSFKDYMAMTESVSGTLGKRFLLSNFNLKRTTLAGATDKHTEGALYLRSLWSDTLTNVPKVNVNYHDEWHNTMIFGGSNEAVPGTDRAGIEFWQYLNGTEKQLMKTDAKSDGTTYFTVHTDEAFLPNGTQIKSKSGSYQGLVSGMVEADLTSIHGPLQGNMSMYLGNMTFSANTNANWVYGDYTFSGAENIFLVLPTVYGANSHNYIATALNQSSTGFRLHLAHRDASGVLNDNLEVRFLIFYERG